MPDPASDPHSALALALAYAAGGMRVLPIKPGTKRPPMNEWVQAATTDPDIITNWYTEPLYRDHGVGLAMGRQPDGRFIFALDVDEHDPAHSGSETLTDLTAEHGPLPDTVCSITGSGGLHLLFETPGGIEVRNGIAGDGLDVRGEGGQIVVAPSIHPVTGKRYEWEDRFAPWECEIALAPDWLIELVRQSLAPAAQIPASRLPVPTFNNPDSPAEWLRSWWDWPSELANAGWTEHHTNRNGDVMWTRPGKDRREGESAILHPDGAFIVFSTDASMTGLHAVGHVNRDGSVTVSPFEFFAAREHSGNLSAAARFLVTKMPGAVDSRLSTVTPADPDEEPDADLEPFKAQRLDWHKFFADDHTGEQWLAEPLIPAGRLVALYAPAKQGKSEVALAVVAALATGRPILGQPNPYGPRDAMYLDYEMTLADLSERLAQLGYPDPDEMEHFHYWPLPSLPPLDTAYGASVARRLAAWCGAKVMVIDTFGRSVEGDENSNDTFRAFARHTGLALKADGVAVLRTDHAGKDREKGQRGASAKNDDADVVFRVDRVEDGWKLQRTHTRINWVPDKVLIDRTEMSNKTLLIELAGASKPSYPTGTVQYADDLERLGVVVDLSTTRDQLRKMAKAIDPKLGMSNDMMSAALKLLKERQNRPAQVSPGGSPAPVTHSGPDQPGEVNTEPACEADSHLSADPIPGLGDIR